jgi:hypothetical protein
MLAKISIQEVQERQHFYYANRTYVLANVDEKRKHPAHGTNGVLAYHIPDRGDRVPVSFNPTSEVWVDRK